MIRALRARLPHLTPDSRHHLLSVAGIGLDLLVVLVLFWIRVEAQLREQPFASLLGTPAPPEWWWQLGWLGDWILTPGPDAGNWAIEMQNWLDGVSLDSHRPPVFTLFGAMASTLFGDVVFAGHMVNHLLSFLVVLGTYALGRSTSGRGPALAAALLVATYPDLIADKGKFGVDPSQHLAILTLTFCTWWATQGRWWRLLPAGLAVGFAAAAHFFSMAFTVPAALMLVLSDPPWRRYVPGWLPLEARKLLYREFAWKWLFRITAPIMVLIVGYATFLFLMRWHPNIALSDVVNVYIEGVFDMSGQRSGAAPALNPEDAGQKISFAQAVTTILGRLDKAPALLYDTVLKPWMISPLSWQPLVFLGGLGLLGPGLRKSPPRAWVPWDWRPGVWFAVFLLPLVGMAASGAPPRYFLWAMPIIFLVIARGLGSLATGMETLFRRLVPAWPQGSLSLLVCAVAGIWLATSFSRDWTAKQRFPVDTGLVNRRIGKMVRAQFGPGDCIVTGSQEQLFYTGRFRFLAASCAPGNSFGPLESCLTGMLSQCPNDEDIPYVLTQNKSHGVGDRPNMALRAIVLRNFKVAGTVKYKHYTVKIYRMKRKQLEVELDRLRHTL